MKSETNADFMCL